MFSIGTTLTFCVEALIDEDVYVLAELHPITLPTSVRDIPEFVTDLDRIKDVYLNVNASDTEPGRELLGGQPSTYYQHSIAAYHHGQIPRETILLGRLLIVLVSLPFRHLFPAPSHSMPISSYSLNKFYWHGV